MTSSNTPTPSKAFSQHTQSNYGSSMLGGGLPQQQQHHQQQVQQHPTQQSSLFSGPSEEAGWTVNQRRASESFQMQATTAMIQPTKSVSKPEGSMDDPFSFLSGQIPSKANEQKSEPMYAQVNKVPAQQQPNSLSRSAHNDLFDLLG